MSLFRSAVLVFALVGAFSVAQANCGSCGTTATKKGEQGHEHAACVKCAHAAACTVENCADEAHKAECTCEKTEEKKDNAA